VPTDRVVPSRAPRPIRISAPSQFCRAETDPFWRAPKPTASSTSSTPCCCRRRR